MQTPFVTTPAQGMHAARPLEFAGERVLVGHAEHV